MRWTPQEDAVLKSMYAEYSRQQIAGRLNRTEGMVRSRCWTLGLRDKINQWTESEVSQLRAAYSHQAACDVGLTALAEKLERNKANVCRKARSLGLTNQRRKKVRVRKIKINKFSTDWDRRAAQGETTKKWIAERGHPKGMLGKSHNADTRGRLSQHMKANWAAAKTNGTKWMSKENRQKRSDAFSARMVNLMKNGRTNLGYSRARRGKRDGLGDYFFRSGWEANFARYLNFLVSQKQIQKWEYETETFWFEAIRRGVRSYTPDFKVWRPDDSTYFIEVKGWMDKKSATKLKRMKIYHPKVEIELVDEKRYMGIKRNCSALIPGWEAR